MRNAHQILFFQRNSILLQGLSQALLEKNEETFLRRYVHFLWFAAGHFQNWALRLEWTNVSSLVAAFMSISHVLGSFPTEMLMCSPCSAFALAKSMKSEKQHSQNLCLLQVFIFLHPAPLAVCRACATQLVLWIRSVINSLANVVAKMPL